MGKYITIDEILGELKDHPMLEDLTPERVMSYAVNFARRWGTNILFEEKIETIKAEDYRVVLPCDFYELITLRDHNSKINYRYSTDIYHIRPEEFKNWNWDRVNHELLTYKVNGNILFLSTKDNEVDVVYQAIATDSNGFPLILDDAIYIKTLCDYIKKERFTILFDLGKIQISVLQNAQQEYEASAYVLRNHFALPSPDQLESCANLLNNMIIHRGHQRGFKHTSEFNKSKF